ncbi:MAG TPA: 23S rRNA (uracil(1939)-C(5))-methyltransferase RlmD [Bacillota bacterium]|nr:23S rRNA (uracil(1939)-C(5))-methyltransferase RlmD [Bacillota bacterium]
MENNLPVMKNKEYEMKIDNLGVNGEGIGRIEGFTIFVEGGLPNERVFVKIVKLEKRHAFGKLLRIIKASDDRIEARCPYYGRCGGCQLQHLSYEAQLLFKRQLVIDAFERIGHLKGVRVKETKGMESPWEYRNKAQFPVGLVKDKLTIGFYAARSHDLVGIDSCDIQNSINDKLLSLIKTFIKAYNIPIYDERSHKGVIRHIVTRVGYNSQELMVIIVTKDDLPHKDELVDILKEGIRSITSIVHNRQKSRTNVILGNENTVLWGKDHILDELGGLRFKISPLSFYQVNPVQTEKLYKKALEYANLAGGEIVIDAYCGIGTISLFLAQNAGRVYGIELVDQAIEDARENAKMNGIENAQFIKGHSETLIPQMSQQGLKADVVVVDPPRKGCDKKLLEAIVEMGPNRLVYVSCNPATLARDLSYLNENGYKIIEAQPVDLFPQTYHVETVVLMSRK